jgi:hypothetical protein
MEFCGGGSVADLLELTGKPFREEQIAYVCKETLKVLVSIALSPYGNTDRLRGWRTCTRTRRSIATSRAATSSLQKRETSSSVRSHHAALFFFFFFL